MTCGLWGYNAKTFALEVYIFIHVLNPIAGCGGAEYAKDKGIPVVMFPKSKDEPGGLSPSELVSVLR